MWLVPYVKHDTNCLSDDRCTCGMTMRLVDMQRAVRGHPDREGAE
jgi:hypothetical protein